MSFLAICWRLKGSFYINSAWPLQSAVYSSYDWLWGSTSPDICICHFVQQLLSVVCTAAGYICLCRFHLIKIKKFLIHGWYKLKTGGSRSEHSRYRNYCCILFVTHHFGLHKVILESSKERGNCYPLWNAIFVNTFSFYFTICNE